MADVYCQQLPLCYKSRASTGFCGHLLRLAESIYALLLLPGGDGGYVSSLAFVCSSLVISFFCFVFLFLSLCLFLFFFFFFYKGVFFFPSVSSLSYFFL